MFAPTYYRAQGAGTEIVIVSLRSIYAGHCAFNYGVF
jgi:hypothetical protein